MRAWLIFNKKNAEQINEAGDKDVCVCVCVCVCVW